MTTATPNRRTHRFIAELTPATLRSEQQRLSRWLADNPTAWNRPDVEQALRDVQTQREALEAMPATICPAATRPATRDTLAGLVDAGRRMRGAK